MDFRNKEFEVDYEVMACKKEIYSNFGNLHFSQMKEIKRVEISKQDSNNLLVKFCSENREKEPFLTFLIYVENSEKAYQKLKESFEGTPEMKTIFFV